MERVVYILGAGFSQPLGLPLVSDFILKSKDLFALDPEKYSHFSRVFKEMRDLAVIQGYFNADLFNLEEVFSIIDMKRQLSGRTLQSDFQRYIKDVIRQYTPNIPEFNENNWHWTDYLFGESGPWHLYGPFATALLRAKYHTHSRSAPIDVCVTPIAQPTARYDVVSLNYDCVLEAAAGHIAQFVGIRGANDFRFYRPGNSNQNSTQPILCKLHGSVDEGDIIPPTWSKAVSKHIRAQWHTAHELLASANHIRFIGYSLPEADSYVRYLLKSAIVGSTHLKSVDVLTLDSDGSVRRRYDSFISFNFYRFATADVKKYLQEVGRSADVKFDSGAPPRSLIYGDLEECHDRFMKINATS